METVFWSTFQHVWDKPAWFLMQCHLRAWKSHTFNRGFLPCPTWTEISMDSLWTYTSLSCIEKYDFWIFIQFSNEIWHKVVSHNWDAPFIPTPITNSPAYCGLFQNRLNWIFCKSFSLLSQIVYIYQIQLIWPVKT